MKINNLNWTVCLAYLEDGTMGLTTYSNQTIQIQCGMIEECIRLTLMHEIVHAYLYSYGFNQNQREFHKEELCEFIAQNVDNLIKLRDIAMIELNKSRKYVKV